VLFSVIVFDSLKVRFNAVRGHLAGPLDVLPFLLLRRLRLLFLLIRFGILVSLHARRISLALMLWWPRIWSPVTPPWVSSTSWHKRVQGRSRSKFVTTTWIAAAETYELSYFTARIRQKFYPDGTRKISQIWKFDRSPHSLFKQLLVIQFTWDPGWRCYATIRCNRGTG